MPELPTAVLVHGAGHTAAVWDATRSAMVHPSLAVDLPGRASRPGDITSVTVAEAADAVVADVVERLTGDIVLVGHSVAGTILPTVVARLAPRVRHLVFVAGITAPDGTPPFEVFLPGQGAMVTEHLVGLRRAHAGRSLEGMTVKDASSIDSLNFSSQPMRWHGLGPAVPRTFVRCLRDPIQPRELQARFIANCGAGDVVDIDAGHTPAIDAPVLLAGIIDRIVETTAATR
jgi:pimeloyl-ACP methyl ester carboxylesterase